MSTLLSTIPPTWESTRLDRVATVNARIGWKALTAAEYQPDGYAFLATPNIKGVEIDFDNVNYISDFRYHESPELQLQEGDVLLTKDGFTLGTVNVVTNLPRPATVNGSIAVLRPFGMHSRFLRYAIASTAIQQHMWAAKNGMDVLHLFQRDIKKIPLPSPPIEEQRRIADFLDGETARIDRLATLRHQQMGLWSDRFHTFVRQQVTAAPGLTSRGDEIDWLGHIPADWQSATINRLARFAMGTTFPHAYQGQRSGEYPFIKVSDFQSADELDRMISAENWITKEVAVELGARIVPAGAILYARVGAALLLNRRRITTRPSVIDDNVRAICFTQGDPRFWAAVLSLLDMGQLSNPGPVPSIGEGQVAAVRVPNPDEKAQIAIADRLERYRLHSIRTRSAIERQLHLLTERRQALITAAVTGQFDVSTASGRNVTDGVSA